MTVAATKPASSLPQRADIDSKHKWNLADIYNSEQNWEADFAAAETLIEKAKSYQGRLAGSAGMLFECLESRSKLGLIRDKLHAYARLNQDMDSRVSKYQAMTDRAISLSARASAGFAFVEPELLRVSDNELLKLADQFPRKDIYDFYIKELIRSRAHIRSEEVEELLAQSLVMAQGPDNVFNMLDNADLKYPVIKDENGEDLQLTKQRYNKIILESSSQQLRRTASDAFMSVYKAHVNTASAALSNAVNKDIFYARARRFDSSLHHSLDAGNIPVSVYHNLLDTTEAGLEGLHKWIAARKRVLKLESLYTYDVYCPLFPEQKYSVPYGKAVDHVLEAIAPLGEKYRTALNEGFNRNWVDVYETEGKRGGAYSWGNYASHPFVLMNYNDTIENMFTLAHEMGHAMHSYLSNKSQPYPKASYSIFVAEVASTLNEGLLLQRLLRNATDDKQKLFLLNRHIDSTLATFLHQVMFARFEMMIHEAVEQGGALSPEIMSEMWEKLTLKYYGPAMTLDDYARYKWARIPHFYWTFYVFQYATSYAASQAILSKFLAGEAGIVDKYLDLLSSGGNNHPIEQLKKCGVDMTTPAPIEATLKLFAREVDELDRLAR
jgi:oligoendopeptidase F